MIDIQNEKLIRLEDVRDYLPSSRKGKKLGKNAVFRWAGRGVRGAVLETVKICGGRYTSLASIQRFIEAQNPPPPDSAPPAKPPVAPHPKGVVQQAAEARAHKAATALEKLGI